MVFSGWDFASLPEKVDRLAAEGIKGANFVLTLQCHLDEAKKVKDFGLTRPAGTGEYHPADASTNAELKAALKAAFARASKHGLEIAILPHLDATGDHSDWRNHFDFDPLTPVSGATYRDHFLLPVLEALEEALPAETPVQFALAGEMGRTVWAHPESWAAILRDFHTRGKLNHVQFGLSLNHGEIGGQHVLQPAQREPLQALLKACDFIGISAYHRIHCPVTAADFTWGIDEFAAELGRSGLEIPAGQVLHFSEVGLGGLGQAESGAQTELDGGPEDVARSPWMGSPDKQRHPWTTEPRKKFRRDYHRALLDFLRTQPARWPVTRAYLWSMGSWCPYGFKGAAEFRDETIVADIATHNKAVTGPGKKP